MKKFDDVLLPIARKKLSYEEINKCANSDFYLKELKLNLGDNIYKDLMYSITFKELKGSINELCWYQLTAHMRTLNAKLQRNVGIFVAAMDYFNNIEQNFSEPLIVEYEKILNLSEKATSDELTLLYNRRIFNVFIKVEALKYKRESSLVCLLMIDVDQFKNINSQGGHQVGDSILSQIGHIVGHSVRDIDIAARYGGDELAVIMPETSLKEARHVAERIRLNIEKHYFQYNSVTVSIGVSQMSDFISTSEQLISTADAALYKAKFQGANQVVCIEPSDKI